MNDQVSRETGDAVPVVPAAPEAAGTLFPGRRLPLVERYAELLATEGVTRGVIGPRETPRLWDRHLLNSAVLGELVPDGVRVADLGSGAGLPGLVLALARPDLEVTLVEPLLRRTTFLTEVVEELELDQVEVVRGRAEELHGRRRFDLVTSRAVAPLGRLLRWSMPLVEPHGAMVAMKGSSASREIEEATEDLARLGCAAPEVLTLGRRTLPDTTSAVRVAWADPARVDWPSASSRGAGPGRPEANRSGRRGGRSGRRGARQRDRRRRS